MRIAIEEQTRSAMKVLNIKAYPFTSKELTKKFRPLIMMHHPDKDKDNSTASDIAGKLIDAYRYLQGLTIDEARKTFEDEDSFTIWDTCEGLGKMKVNPFFNSTVQKGEILSTFA